MDQMINVQALQCSYPDGKVTEKKAKMKSAVMRDEWAATG
jgi:hypothetical protein